METKNCKLDLLVWLNSVRGRVVVATLDCHPLGHVERLDTGTANLVLEDADCLADLQYIRKHYDAPIRVADGGKWLAVTEFELE